MKKWDFNCNCFKEVRKLIDEDIRTVSQCFKIMDVLECCCDELTPDNKSEWIYYDAFIDMKSEIHDEIEYMDETDYESCEDTVNYFLGEFYDLCDSANVWLTI